jgi:hypothetical protein
MTRWLGWSLIVAALVTASLAPAHAQYPSSGPISPVERSWTESSRDVPATEYRDAYCARWTDGCTTCQRTNANDQPACQGMNFNLFGACQRQLVQCRAELKTINRVCLVYRDGCNSCILGGCTALYCFNRDMNYRCITPRRTRYDDPNTIKTDLHGIWRLTTPRGKACEIVIGSGVQLTPACVALGSPVTEIRGSRMAGSNLQLIAYKGEPLITFDTSDLDGLTGVGASSGFRMLRLEARAWNPRYWESAWRIRHGGYACDLFLTMRRLWIAPPQPGEDAVRTPHQISLAAGCLNPADENQIRITHAGHRPPVLLPRWTGWEFEALNLIFRDDKGRRTVFTSTGDGTWQSTLQQEGYPPSIMRMERRGDRW